MSDDMRKRAAQLCFDTWQAHETYPTYQTAIVDAMLAFARLEAERAAREMRDRCMNVCRAAAVDKRLHPAAMASAYLCGEAIEKLPAAPIQAQGVPDGDKGKT